MVEALCNKLTLRIRKSMPDVDDERAEIINYGLQLLIGEIPKTFIILLIAWIMGVLDLSIVVLLLATPYRAVSGGAHFTTHIECIIATSLFYTGNALLSKYLVLNNMARYIIVFITWISSMIFIKRYAPADTEAVPILREKERKLKRTLSYIVATTMLILSILVKNRIISNMILNATILQTIALTPFMYKIARNKYGYAEYIKNNK